ncbi:hypothetical protein [Geoalkalibacter sp.]|uniref:hypothetical protein n=1 Tax=Geoalkalibacter sp. TaxID=3041440 RepID=UPI00272EBD3E|nr:hypothetical protein [Geoalkalibacter sp.]
MAQAAEYRNEFTAGYRKDKLVFTIAGDSSGSRPNVLSELEWKTDAFYLAGDLWMLWPRDRGPKRPNEPAGRYEKSLAPALRLWGGYGFVFSGDNQDSDFFADNRQMEFSRSNNSSDNGSVWDIQGAIGMEFARRTKNNVRASLTPYLGYSYHAQNFQITDGNQTIATEDFTPPPGPFPGLNSRYETEWYGPLVGLHLLYVMEDNQSRPRLALWGDATYHFMSSYKAEGRWNLRSDFAQDPSFRHLADGGGWKLAGGFLYNTSLRSSWGLDAFYTSWLADEDGVARVFFSDGIVVDTRLNEADWDAWMIGLRYSYKFY